MHSMHFKLEIYSWEGGEKKVGNGLFVSLFVCSSISASGGQTDGRIGTGAAPSDAPERRNDDGAGPGSVRATRHVQRGARQTLAQNFRQSLQATPMERESQNSAAQMRLAVT